MSEMEGKEIKKLWRNKEFMDVVTAILMLLIVTVIPEIIKQLILQDEVRIGYWGMFVLIISGTVNLILPTIGAIFIWKAMHENKTVTKRRRVKVLLFVVSYAVVLSVTFVITKGFGEISVLVDDTDVFLNISIKDIPELMELFQLPLGAFALTILDKRISAYRSSKG